MEIDLIRKAVRTALQGNWKEAISLNLQILKNNPEDVEALNRLARAYAEVGKLKTARSVSQKVLKIDPNNHIASKSLLKWDRSRPDSFDNSDTQSQENFLEEPGKTKLVTLLHPGDARLLAKLYSGDSVKLIPSAHRINVLTKDGKYIGRFPDNISARLRQLIKLGNCYRALVKSTDGGGIKIFVRETVRGNAAKDIPSFPPEKIDYISFTPPELVHKDRMTPNPDIEEEGL